MSPEPELRYELKVVLPEGYLPRLWCELRVHPSALRELFPPRRVNSLYFDTESLARLDQNHAGLARRAKMRFRWYGEELAGAKGALEIKHRRGRLGHKSLFPIDDPVDLACMDWRELFAHLRAQLPEEARLALRAFSRPVLLNRYRRHYLATADRRLRVTVDHEQRFYGQWGTRRPNLRRPLVSDREIVLEAKAAKSDEELVRAFLERLPYSVGRNSKYVAGCQGQSLLR